MDTITPVILCGGSGTRLWPRSRATMPKPFLPLVGEATLFEQALLRASDPAHFAPPIIVTGAAHLEHVEAQLALAADARVIIEPAAKNTAAAIGLAAASLPDEAVMLVCPSDHHIGDGDAFVAAARAAARLAGEGWLVAFGIAATTPETGYGYIRSGDALNELGSELGEALGFKVAEFVEKPEKARAEAFLADGSYSWNGGIFAFRAGDFMAELAAHRPEMAAAVRQAVANGHSDGQRFYPDPAAFATINGESVDYAVMENTARAAMVPAEMAWSDIGNWHALHAARAKDHTHNCVSGRVELVDCRHVLVETDGPRVSVIGLENIIVVVNGDEVLVTSAAGTQKVGKLSGALNQ